MGGGKRVKNEVLRERRKLPNHHRPPPLPHLSELRVRERLLLREKPRVLKEDDVPYFHLLDRLNRVLSEQAVDIPHRVPEEGSHPVRVGLEGREVVLPGAGVGG